MIFHTKQCQKGGKVLGSISTDTTTLVVKSLDKVGSKLKKAEELGVEILEKPEFISKYIDGN